MLSPAVGSVGAELMMNSRDVKETAKSQMASLSMIEGNVELLECQAYVLLRVGAHVVGSILDFTSDAHRGRLRHTHHGILVGEGSRFQSRRHCLVSYAVTK